MRAALPFALVALFLAPSLNAVADPAQGDSLPAGWWVRVAFDWNGEGGNAFTLRSPSSGARVVAAFLLYRPSQGPEPVHAIVGLLTHGETYATVDPPLMPGTTIMLSAEEDHGNGGGSLAFGCSTPCPENADRYEMLMFLAGDIPSSTFHWSPGVDVVSTETGPGAFYVRLREFEGEIVSAENEGLGLGAAVAQHRLSFDEGVLIVQFSATAGNAWIAGPHGQSCPCRLYSASGPNARGPGDYTFNLFGGEALPLEYMLLAGAIVR